MPNKYWPNRIPNINENTDGRCLAHINFNPWYHQQFGIAGKPGTGSRDTEGNQTMFGALRAEEYFDGICFHQRALGFRNWGRVRWGTGLSILGGGGLGVWCLVGKKYSPPNIPLIMTMTDAGDGVCNRRHQLTPDRQLPSSSTCGFRLRTLDGVYPPVRLSGRGQHYMCRDTN